MSTESKPNNNEQKIPKILDRDEVIILSQDEVCKCGRPKDRPHCPNCGSVQTYGMARTSPAKLENGDIMKGCRSYRCIACGTRYNDMEWYFGCRAHTIIDWAATKKMWKEKERRASMEWWRDRIITMYHAGKELRPSYNELQKFNSQVGGSFEEFAKAMVDIERDKENQRLKEEVEKLKAGLTESGFKYPVIRINDPDDPDKKGG